MATTCDQALQDAHATIGRFEALVWDLWDILDKDELRERFEAALAPYATNRRG